MVTIIIDSPLAFFLCWKLCAPNAPKGDMARIAPNCLDGFSSARLRNLSTFHFSQADPMPSGMIMSIATRKT